VALKGKVFCFSAYAAGSEIHSIEMDQLWSPMCTNMVRGTGILTRKKYLLLMKSILVFWRIILQMKFTIFCDGMFIVHCIGTGVLFEPVVTVQDKKESRTRYHIPLTHWFNLTRYKLSHPKRQYQCRHHCENLKSYTDLRNSNQVRTYFILWEQAGKAKIKATFKAKTKGISKRHMRQKFIKLPWNNN